MRVRQFLLAVIVLAGSMRTTPTAQAPRPDLIPRLRHWTASVLEHQPGAVDDAVRATWALSPEDRAYLQSRIPLFISALGPTPPNQTSRDVAAIIVLAGDTVVHISAVDFLERAAILHADAAMFDRRVDQTPVTELPVMRGVSARGRATLRAGTDGDPSQEGFVTTRDGEITGHVLSNPNWAFARFVLDRIPTGRADPFIGLWYHAVAAYFFKNGRFGDADTHLAHAANVLPTDARLLFDRGALAEVLSMSLMQEAANDAAHQIQSGGILTLSAPSALPPPEKGREEAVGFYQRAIRVDPKLAEAHVRLARLLDLQGRDQEGLDQIHLTLDFAPDNEVLFYAHLFGVRVAAALGQFSDADAHALAALALFPHAQSATLAASQAALGRGDTDRAQALTARLADQDGSPAILDPWIIYPYGPGRSADNLLAQLWQATPAVH
jgi:tetratricopeptide (TPR) repeat protein